MKKWIQVVFAICGVLVSSSLATAQSQPESSTLVIESQDGSHKHTLHVGDRLNYQVRGGTMQRKGRIEAIQDSSMTIAARQVVYADLDAVVHVRGKKKPAGMGLLIGSLVAEPISLLFWVVSLLFLLDNPSAGQRVIIGILTALTLFIFPLLIILGVVLVAVGSKRFDLRKKWKIHKG